MGWFNKKDDKKEFPKQSAIQLPKLPELPELPPLDDSKIKDSLHQLPSFPNSSFGDNFSRNTIKDAVTGSSKKEFDAPFPKGDRVFGADEFAPSIKNFGQKMQKTLNKPEKKMYDFPRTKEIEPPEEDEDFEEEPDLSPEDEEDEEYEESEEPQEEYEESRSSSEDEEVFKGRGPNLNEPVYIRIDKFEEALKTFEKTKREIAEIEKNLKDITAVREDEDRELQAWQENLIKVKDQIEKIDEDIFSKI